MFSFCSIFLASLCSLMLKILGLIHKHIYISKSSLAEDKDESSVSFQSGLVSKNSKCQILSGNNNVSGFLEEPKTAVGFVVQELFVGEDNVVVSSDQSEKIMGFEQSYEEKSVEFDQKSDFSSPFYFKLFNPNSPFSNEEKSSEMEKTVSLVGVYGEEEEEEEVDFRVEEDEEFAYEIELIPSSHSSTLSADQESDGDRDCAAAPEKVEKNDWMSSFLDEVDHENEASFDDDEFIEVEPQCVKLSDELDLDLDRGSDDSCSPTSCADANTSQQEPKKCWDSDCDEDEDEDEQDVLSQHQNLVQQMKMELKSCRIGGLPTISEDSETPKVVEDLRPLEIDHKIGYKELMEGIQRFYKSYAEKMRKLDILNYQTAKAISFLQLKDCDVFTAGKKRGSSVLPRFLAGKVRRVYADPMHKTLSQLRGDLEVVYVGQICLSWEILWWLDARAWELLEHGGGEGRRSYNRAAEEFQQFQVLLQRFMEDEPFQGRRNDNYVRTRCALRSFLQVPTIKDDCGKMSKELEGDVITLEMLMGIISETMVIFQDFVFGDKKVMTNSGGLMAKLDDVQQHGLLLDVVSSLDKKGRRMKEVMRGQTCIVRKMRKHEERGLDREMAAAQVDLRLVSRVLNMSRLSGDQLVWCQKKLNNIDFVGRKMRRDACFLLFP
ncbi:uncharacterized protein LOC131025208 [Salvia miltiorrhiza]|uniref:uncharacterized protein LOC131025208 n=1 Tax=Salvia miltiorrhiza TaxID=226208 RepID=UPI0025AC7D55|nr:uncharacterized protein LOC131025208 [Salvia miltiorrhiza]